MSTALRRPTSGWRAAYKWLLVPALVLWGLGVSVTMPRHEYWGLVGLAGGLGALAAWFVLPSRWRPRIMLVGLVVACFGLSTAATWLAMIPMLIILTGSYGLRRGLVGAAAVWACIACWIPYNHQRIQLLHYVMFLVILVGCLALGLFAGWLVHHTERTADELWQVQRRLEAQSATQRDAVVDLERTRAAQEMHDGLGHELTLMRMSLEFARRVRETDPAGAWGEVEEAERMCTRALADMRAWVRAMSPPSADGGIGPMLQALAASFRGTGLEVAVSLVGDDGPLPQPQALLVRRVVQESLTNTLKHSDATRVRVDIARHDRLLMSVTDNGTRCQGQPREGFGLRSMRERAEELGGSARYRCLPDGGFETRLDVPLPDAGSTGTPTKRDEVVA